MSEDLAPLLMQIAAAPTSVPDAPFSRGGIL